MIVPHSCDLVHCTAFLLRGSVRPPPTKKSGWAQFTASAPGRQEPYSYATDNGGVKKTAPGKNEKTRLQSLDTHTVIISSAAGWGHLAIPRSVPLSVPWRSCPRRAAALGYRHAGCLQLSHELTADPSADGRRSAASRTAIGGELVEIMAESAVSAVGGVEPRMLSDVDERRSICRLVRQTSRDQIATLCTSSNDTHTQCTRWDRKTEARPQTYGHNSVKS